MNTISKSEMRAIRRQFINEYLFNRFDVGKQLTLSEIKYYVRFLEFVNFDYEMKAYQ